MATAMTLIERLENDRHLGFEPKPRYHAHGDFVTYFDSADRCVARRLNSLVTVYTSIADGRFVGCKVKGVKRLLQEMKAFEVMATDGKIAMRFFFYTAAISEGEGKQELRDLADRFGNASLPLDEVCTAA